MTPSENGFSGSSAEGTPPYVPTSERALSAMIEIARPLDNELAIDLGCGDARLLIECSRLYNTRGIGVELDAKVAQVAKEKVAAAGLSHLIDIYVEDLFETDVEDADIVFCYLNENFMRRLVNKFKNELSEGARVVSQHFALPGVTRSAVSQEVRGSRIFAYEY